MSFAENYYVDCDFHAEAAKCNRMLGCAVKPAQDRRFGSVSPIFEERFREQIIPEVDWQSLYDDLKPDYSRHKTWQYDQNGEGTCTANATAGCMSYCWSKTYGAAVGIAPAPTSMYRHCARGPNSGSSTSCNLRRARDHGTLLIDNSGNRQVLQKLGLDSSHVIPAVGWNSRIPSGAMEETAKHFRLAEFYEIRSTEGFFSALLFGFDILYGRSGHAIHGVDIVKRDGSWYCKYDNSWGNWGDRGFGYDSLAYIRRTSAPYGAYAFQTMIEPPGIAGLLGVPPLV